MTTYRVEIGGQAFTVDVDQDDAGISVLVGDGPPRTVDVLVNGDDGELALVVGGETIRGLVGLRNGGLTIVSSGGIASAMSVLNGGALELLVGAPVEDALLPASLASLDPAVRRPSAGMTSDVLLHRPDVLQAAPVLAEAAE